MIDGPRTRPGEQAARVRRFSHDGVEPRPDALRVLILSENLPVPQDRRVWKIARSLRNAGHRVTIISPRGSDGADALLEERDGIVLHRFMPRPSSGGALGYAAEYSQALFEIARRVRSLSRRSRFDVVHACNPPDFLFAAAWPLRRRGARFVFDHHDLVPELYLSRFRARRDVFYWSTRVFERFAYRLADVVLATNESYRRVAIERGKKDPADVYVVRNAPDLESFTAGAPDRSLKRGRAYLLAYIGVIGPQDGVDVAIRALGALAERRRDWCAVIVGDGDSLMDARELARSLHLDEHVEFLGWRTDADVIRILSSADVCLAPEPKNPLNEVSTMVKVGEYMAMAKPIVAFDLPETRASALDAACYAPPGDTARFAAHIDELLNDPDRRSAMGAYGRTRVEEALAWTHSERQLLAAYDRLGGTRKTLS